MIQNLTEQHRQLQENCLTRLRLLRVLLDAIERKVRDHTCILNDLGELQGAGDLLDCRIAALATLRRICDCGEADPQPPAGSEG